MKVATSRDSGVGSSRNIDRLARRSRRRRGRLMGRLPAVLPVPVGPVLVLVLKISTVPEYTGSGCWGLTTGTVTRALGVVIITHTG